MPMGLIRWLKKDRNDSTLQHRRESAPARTLRNFDANKTRDDEYNKAMFKFNEWRENERNRRASMDRSERNDDHEDDTHDDCSAQFQSAPNRITTIESSEMDDEVTMAGGSGGYTYGSTRTNGFHDSMMQPSQQQPIYGNRIPRHSLPASMNKLKSKRTKKPQHAPSTIHEDEVKEFEASHCYGHLDGNDSRTPFNSPPTKFYKQNSNPYAGSTMSQHLFDGNCDGASTHTSLQRACPEKPKRIMLKQQNTSQLTRELSGAHFSGAYKNYEIQSPFYAADSDRMSEKPIMAAGIRAAAIPSSSSNDTGDERGTKSSRNRGSGHYQVILNKHGDEVEYALPLVEQAQESGGQFRPMLGDNNRYTSDAPNYDDEIFVEDPRQCEQIVGRMFNDSDDDYNDDDEYESGATIRRNNNPSVSMSKTNVMVTDLDKSMESSKTLETKRKPQAKQMFCGVNSLPMATVAIQSQRNQLEEFFNTIRDDVLVCSANDLKRKATVLRNTCASPMEFFAGTYRKTSVTLRNFSPAHSHDIDGRFISESVLRRDLEILKKIRHGDIINLMAISCNTDFNEITLVLEPVDYTLHYFLHQMGREISIHDSISIVQQMASATLYLQECGLVHSNISAHTVLMGKCSHSVKLTSFELVTEITSDTKTAIERKYKRNSKVISLCDSDGNEGVPKKSPKTKSIEGTLIDRYRTASKAQTIPLNNCYSAQTLRDVDVNFLPYCVDYRKQLAVHNCQAPELLMKGERFVFPTEVSDVYSLTLLLWELLNNCVPFAIYDSDELNDLYATHRASLPIFEPERCASFKQIFKFGLETDPISRSMTVHHLIQSLEDNKSISSPQKHNHVMHENSLYGSVAAKPIPLTSHVPTNVPSAANQSTYDIPKRCHTTKLVDNIYENTVDAMTPPSKIQQSPLNNVTNSTLQRSILDYQKLLSPLRAVNPNIYERARTSTLKKRKKQSPNKPSPSSEPLDKTGMMGNGEEETMNFGDEFSPKLNENIQTHTPLSAVKQKPSMVRNLNYESGNATPPAPTKQCIKSSQSFIERPKANNNSSHFVLDDYELPQHLIARNNKIRRNTWLSSDTVNMTTNSMAAQQSPSKTALSCASVPKSPLMNESGGNRNKTLNVTLRIVTKQLTPPGSEKSNSSVASNNSIASNASAAEESPSVLTRIQYFSSLENPSNFTIGGAACNRSRRSEISFDEAVKQSNRRTQMKMLSAASPPLSNNNRQLLKDINDIADEISKCLNNNRFDQRKNASAKGTENNLHVGYVSPVLPIENNKSGWQSGHDQTKKTVSALVQKLFGDEMRPDADEVDAESSNEKRNSVKETVQRIEHVLQHQQTPPSHNVSVNGPFRKIENKLLNEKIVNTESQSPSKIPPSNEIRCSNTVARTAEMCEKVEDVMQIVGLSECENDAGQPTGAMPKTATTRSNHTVIKRTFYQESFISGTNVELPQLEKMLDAQSPQNQPNTYAATKSSSTTKLTTQVTVNLRQFKRRLSDAGLAASQSPDDACTKRMADIRHSVCGNELYELHQKRTAHITDATEKSDQQFSHRKNATTRNHAIAASSNCIANADMSIADLSTVRTQTTFNNRQIQSIEDLYIDDDFCADMGLAANMKLITHSTDSLDGIDFDLISTRIVEQTAESIVTNHLQQKCIENDDKADRKNDNESNNH